MTSEQIIFM